MDRTSDDHPPSSPSEAFDRLFARLRTRRRLRLMLRGLVVTLLIVTLGSLVAATWMSVSLFAAASVTVGRYIAYTCALAAFAAFVLWPVLRRLDDMQYALQTERQRPQLDGLLLSAVAMRRGAGNTSAELAEEVLRRTVQGDSTTYRLTDEDDRASLRTLGLVVLFLAAVAVGVVLAPAWLQHGLRLLVAPLEDAAAANPFYFDVSPGDAQGNAGEDQLIIASARGFSPREVTLNYRDVDAEHWQQLAMQGDQEDFTGYLRTVSRPLEYFVVSGGVRSPNYRIDVIVQPTLERIDVTYHYPQYTGRAPETVRDIGDIRAPRGTQVEVELLVANAPDGGRLVLDGETHNDLQDQDANTYRGALAVQSNGRYRVELRAENGQFVAVSPEFSIEALEDTLPTVALRTPGRDAQVSSLEEVDVTVEVEDDLGVQELELVLSINGGDEETLAIAAAPDAAKQFQAVKTLYLEERALQPGDLIAYYARARDAIAGAERADVVTDIFFMEVRPFEREFREGQSGGGGGGGGGQQQEQLAAQQRMLVVALYNAVRDQHKFSAEEHRLKLDKIAAAQSRIRARVDAIVRRLEARDIVQLDPGFRQMAQELPKASQAMGEVESELQTGQGASAQTPARTALLHLQRAEAAFRSVRVTRADARGNDAGDLRNLFRLEMDRFRNQYADVRRGQWQSDADRIDKTLEQLRELARRQQREMERAQLRNQRGEGGQGGQSQRNLAEEVERMARELERLSLQDPQMRALAERLRRAAQSMREAAAGNGVADSREALRQLREARRQLRSSGRQRLARDITQAANDARALQREHEDIARQLDGAQNDAQARQALGDRKRAMAERLEQLREQLRRLSQDARDQQAVRDRLASAKQALDEQRVAENIAHTQRLLEQSLPPDGTAENAIGEGLRASSERLEAAAADAQGTDRERIAEVREQLRDVVRGLASMSSESAPGFGGGRDPNRRGRLVGDSVNLRDALRAHAGALRDLRGGLVSRPKRVGDVDDVIAGLQELADDLQDSADSGARHASLLEKLQDIDFALQEAAGDPAEPRQAFAPRQVQPDDRHREIVEAYYRGLSESAND